MEAPRSELKCADVDVLKKDHSKWWSCKAIIECWLHSWCFDGKGENGVSPPQHKSNPGMREVVVRAVRDVILALRSGLGFRV